ncbi:hypothetical protein BC567DRAFT_214497 [Phyllosticta citribraziliensis]
MFDCAYAYAYAVNSPPSPRPGRLTRTRDETRQQSETWIYLCRISNPVTNPLPTLLRHTSQVSIPLPSPQSKPAIHRSSLLCTHARPVLTKHVRLPGPPSSSRHVMYVRPSVQTEPSRTHRQPRANRMVPGQAKGRREGGPGTANDDDDDDDDDSNGQEHCNACIAAYKAHTLHPRCTN